jgi:iron uptake system component EfeO
MEVTRLVGMMTRRMPVVGGALAGAVAAGLLLGGCGDDASVPEGTRVVDVALTDAGCEPAALRAQAGPTTFAVRNEGTTRINEFEVLSGTRVLAEAENVTSGGGGSVTLNLKPGRYTINCPGGTTQATGVLTVGGTATAGTSADADLAAATAGYTSYVESQARELQRRTRRFADAVIAGDLPRAKSLFAWARAPFETIEPVAESFGDLDPQIDARVNDVAPGERWTGFHRIERGLWERGSAAGLAPVARELVADVDALAAKVRGLRYEPEQLANGANELLGEVSASKITGEEDRYSHTDLSDFEANVLGSQAAFGLLAPAVRKRDPRLAAAIEERFAAVLAALEPYRRGEGFVSYDSVGEAERRRLSRQVDALAEPLSRVAVVIQES